MSLGQNQKKILIVEDEEMLLQVLGDEFRHAGFETVLARDGMEGLELSGKELPDIILIDLLMPRMDGLSMLKEIRKQKATASTPVIVLTNLNDTETIQKALESGAYDFLMKSDWEPKGLVERVKEKLNITKPAVA